MATKTDKPVEPLEAAKARIAKLEAALRPFAKHVDAFDENQKAEMERAEEAGATMEAAGADHHVGVRLGDMRAAKSALEGDPS